MPTAQPCSSEALNELGVVKHTTCWHMLAAPLNRAGPVDPWCSLKHTRW